MLGSRFINGHLYLSVRLGANLRTNMKKTFVEEKLNYVLKPSQKLIPTRPWGRVHSSYHIQIDVSVKVAIFEALAYIVLRIGT